MKFPETYSVLVLSTAHLTKGDAQYLEAQAADGLGMIARRSTGLFVKLYDSPRFNHYPDLSPQANDILRQAHEAGHRMVEFDCDARAVEGLPTFDW